MPPTDRLPSPWPAAGARAARRWLARAWCAPCTALGLGLGAVACVAGARARLHTGVLEIAFDDPTHPVARRLARWPFAAITLGHVVLARTQALQAALRAHERVHVAQYEAWGPLFLVAYPAASVVCWLRGRRPYLDNPFEVAARAGEARRQAIAQGDRP